LLLTTQLGAALKLKAKSVCKITMVKRAPEGAHSYSATEACAGPNALAWQASSHLTVGTRPPTGNPTRCQAELTTVDRHFLLAAVAPSHDPQE
jgi:hypothetical protein